MNIETINKSIRPITNLALIGDNDVSYIADLATNIMAGYDIHNDSMDSVADIISSTISRSNVNIVEMAESYKMAAGYLRMAGVDFTPGHPVHGNARHRGGAGRETPSYSGHFRGIEQEGRVDGGCPGNLRENWR